MQQRSVTTLPSDTDRSLPTDDQKFPLTGKAPPINYSAPVKCAAFSPGGACRPNTEYVMLGNFTTAAACAAACEAQRVDGCCWHTDRHIADNCQWVAGGTPFHAGSPALRSSARCARGAPPAPVNVSAFPYAAQSDSYSYQHGAHGDAIKMFSAKQIPVKAAIGKIVMLSRFVAVRLANPKSITIYFSPGVWRLQQALLRSAVGFEPKPRMNILVMLSRFVYCPSR